MTYNEILTAARSCSGPYCKACPVCNGVACGSTTPGAGRDEVRIAYVLKKDDLVRALYVLRKALEAYPGRTI